MSPGGEPGGKREHKIMLAQTAQERQALDAAAARIGMKRATLAARLIRLGVMGAAAGEALPIEVPAAPRKGGKSDAKVGEADGGQVAWLERGRGRSWRAWAWGAGEELRRRYPELNKSNRLPDRWFQDDFTRDGLLSLALWRMELDEGHHHDPRMELAWLRALREFHSWLEQRAPLIGERPAEAREPPIDWIDRGDSKGRRLPVG